jgi:beta-lactamase regulating signal transducer with metallopeptidase domain
MPWIVAAWYTGVLVFFVHLLIGGIAAERLKTKSLMSVPDALHSLARRVAEQLKISQSFQLLTSSAVAGPMVVGWLRPVILVPLTSFSGLPSEQMEAVLAHELAHIRRQDYLMNTLQTIAEALLFYHPAVWWVSKQIRREREHCCDDVAVMMSGSALIYAEALSLLEEQRGSSTTPQLALGANGGQLAMRIKRLLTHRERTAASRGATLSLLSLGIVTGGTVFLFSGVVVSKVGAQSLQPTSQSSSAVPNAINDRRPDMTCTYYDPKGYGYSGTCEARAGQQESYDCRADSGKELTQDQIACGWKVQRLREWELRQRREK